MSQIKILVGLTLEEWDEVYHALTLRVRDTNNETLKRIQRRVAGQIYAQVAEVKE